MAFFSALVTILVTLLAVTRAAPAVARTDCTQHLPQACDPGRYTIEWFLRCTKPGRDQLITNRALFYSADAGPAASALRHSPSSNRFYVTVWDFCELARFATYNNSTSTTNSLYCVHDNELLRDAYYSAMSAAFAQLARESATIMHLDPKNPPTSGIWPVTEHPTLQVSTDVAQLWTVDRTGSLVSYQQIKQTWKQDSAARKAMWATSWLLRQPRRIKTSPMDLARDLGAVDNNDDDRNPYWSEGHPLDDLM
ncbi:hypothetical protein AC578_7855 [Pseudocercospora eumusae]|uniref:Uncharacterized protein n=1 Tax=Pseudocercospora eumusae TaxID=321146 RepID=A0A139HIZ5_9PEZI|nr:hypothetical protein AC578_7855 [Pseudocercospora eumusae]